MNAHASTRRPRLALVGNGPAGPDAGRRIDACERVVRFNDAHGFGGSAGSRVDELFLVNRGGAPAEWLIDPALAHRPAIAAAPSVVLPLHPDSAYLSTRHGRDGRVHRDDADHSERLRARLGSSDRSVTALPARHHERCCASLGLVPCGADRRRPSTGFVALTWYLGTLPRSWRIVLFGFGFAGWEGHPWREEREWVEARARAGAVTVVPVGASIAASIAASAGAPIDAREPA